MTPLEKMRILEVMVDDGDGARWLPCADLGQLEKGDKIRMFEPDDRRPVEDSEGRTEWIVNATPFVETLGLVDELRINPLAGAVNPR